MPKVATRPSSQDRPAYSKIKRRYARWAPRYDRYWHDYSIRTLAHAEMLVQKHAPQAETMLDVACGTGLLQERLHRSMPDLQMTGIDVSADMLELARQRLDKNVSWHVATAESLPVEDDSCDVVTCCNAFHIVSNADEALAEFRRVLRPDGTLIIVDWARDYVTIKLLDAGYKLLPSHRRFIRTSTELRSVVEHAGFDVIASTRFQATWFFKLTSIVAR